MFKNLSVSLKNFPKQMDESINNIQRNKNKVFSFRNKADNSPSMPKIGVASSRSINSSFSYLSDNIKEHQLIIQKNQYDSNRKIKLQNSFDEEQQSEDFQKNQIEC